MNIKKSIILFIIVLFVSCDNGGLTDPSEKLIPEWLKSKITEMENSPYYWGTIVYRHTWRGIYTYHIVIPVSSCSVCDVYNYWGGKIKFSSDLESQQYLKDRYDERIIWYDKRLEYFKQHSN